MKSVIALLALTTSSPAFAHFGADSTQHHFAAGFLHPLSGIDHILAMIAVGVCAGMMRGILRSVLPLVFLASMLAGFAISAAGLFIWPAHETMIIASIVGLGLAIAIGCTSISGFVMPAVVVFGCAHGFAHGIEGMQTAYYAGGFLASTALLHAIGFIVAVLAATFQNQLVYRLSGSALVLTGMLLAWT